MGSMDDLCVGGCDEGYRHGAAERMIPPSGGNMNDAIVVGRHEYLHQWAAWMISALVDVMNDTAMGRQKE